MKNPEDQADSYSNAYYRPSVAELNENGQCREKLLAQNEYGTKSVRIDFESTGFDLDQKKKPIFALNVLTDCGKKASKKCSELLGEDWLLLALMGASIGMFSFVIDVSIQKLRNLHFFLFNEAAQVHPLLQYFVWVFFTLALVLLAAASCHFISPQAVGSGIPEMKTILRGVVLKEYLTFKTLVAKCIGLVLALGSGLPIGKEGPLVHISSMLATLLTKMVASFKGAYENESRSSEMLAAACAVGVASTYGAPIGGVLFSIEVTSVFFPLRNYWRGFFATVCSAIIFRLFAVLFSNEDTLVAFSPTNLPSEYPFNPKEMLAFAFIGVTCGLFAALFIAFHRKYLHFVGETKWVKRLRQKNYIIYPTVVVLIIATLKCPLGYGEFSAGGLTPREALDELFCNFSWNDPDVMNSSYAVTLIDHWSGDKVSVFVVLSLYAFNMFWMTAVANTLPVPCGIFIPVFVAGAAYGRICGEAMALAFPQGLRINGTSKIVPGAYAVVGATAFAGGITHAISSSVIVLEITGQMRYVLPCMLAVLLSIAICAHFQPSLYDSIRIKRHPYLPRIPPTSSVIHRVFVQDIMVRNIRYVSLETTYRQLHHLLSKMKRLRAFPLVDRPSSVILLGSIPRVQLQELLDKHIGDDAWRLEFFRRRSSMRTPKSFKARATISVHPKDVEHVTAIRRTVSDEKLTVKFLANEEEKTRHKSGPETNNARLAARLSSPVLKQAKLWETRVSVMGTYVSALGTRIRQSLGFPALSSKSHSLSEDELNSDERTEWEARQLDQRLNFDELTVDPAPFQLVEKTSLYKVHAIFSLLGLNRAYVTCLGRLVGVVALRELRVALEKAQNHMNPDNPGFSKRSSNESGGENTIHGTSLGVALLAEPQLEEQAPRKLTAVPMDTACAANSLSDRDFMSAVASQQQLNIDDTDDVFTAGPSEYFYAPAPAAEGTVRLVRLNSSGKS